MAEIIEMDFRSFVNQLQQLFYKLDAIAEKRDKSYKRGGETADALRRFLSGFENFNISIESDQPKMAAPEVAKQRLALERQNNPLHFVRIQLGGKPVFSIRQMTDEEALRSTTG